MIETTGHDWWLYFIMPWISGIVGWGTNVVALEMTFQPLEFFGIELVRFKNQPFGLFGWQGIIPSRVEKMASITFDLITTKLLDIQETFNKLEPEKFADAMEEGILLMLDSIISEVAMEYMPKAWAQLPKNVKDEIVIMAERDSTEFLATVMRELQTHIFDVIDMKRMVINACKKNKALVNLVFQECGDKEFAFIRRSGFYFGFVFGCFQMVVWLFYDQNWILPVAGFLVGYITNFLALKVIFRPLEPTEICGVRLHGLFLQRQNEVASTFARIMCVEFFHARALWTEILTGPLSDNFYAILRAHAIVFVEGMVGELEPVAVATMGTNKFRNMKEDIAQKIMTGLSDVIDHSYEYCTEALNLEQTIREALAALSYEAFEGVLHPAFEEDEILLILVGGFLGLLVGVAQLLLFYI